MPDLSWTGPPIGAMIWPGLPRLRPSRGLTAMAVPGRIDSIDRVMLTSWLEEGES
jgi:hypothetical protein